MQEDKLTHDERLKLECLAQANMVMRHASPDEIIQRAKAFEKYVKGIENEPTRVKTKSKDFEPPQN